MKLSFSAPVRFWASAFASQSLAAVAEVVARVPKAITAKHPLITTDLSLILEPPTLADFLALARLPSADHTKAAASNALAEVERGWRLAYEKIASRGGLAKGLDGALSQPSTSRAKVA
jgi:hypothetical protein